MLPKCVDLVTILYTTPTQVGHQKHSLKLKYYNLLSITMNFTKRDCIELSESVINTFPQFKNIFSPGDKCIISHSGDVAVMMKLDSKEWDMLPA